MNVKLLKRVRKMILLRPGEFDMLGWFRETYIPPFIDSCGTTACIAGWTLTLNNQRGSKKRYNPSKFANSIGYFDLTLYPLGQDIPDTAAELLDLTLEESDVLFYLREWAEPFQTQYVQSWIDQNERAQIAARRIDYFIKTGE